MEKPKTSPSLKSASGGGFLFEDKVAALLLCEMLVAKQSIGRDWGIIQTLERQAADWEPFGDLLLTVPTNSGKLVKCGCSVKSNQPVNSNGCVPELRAAFWQTVAKSHFVRSEDALALFSSPLAKAPHTHLNSLCRQARESDVVRLEQKLLYQNHEDARRIYESFRHPDDSTENGLPGHVLAHLIPREFDFEDNTSRDEAEALRLCRELLQESSASEEIAAELWNELLRIAESLRVAGGNATREKLAAKLRLKFQLRDDPSDEAAWARFRESSVRWMDEIETTLPGGLILPRSEEVGQLFCELLLSKGLHVLGESGFGKSALVKATITSWQEGGSEIVWVKTEHVRDFNMTEFIGIAQRIRRKSAILVFDATESCYDASIFHAIGKTIATITSDGDSPWHVILVCQTPEWSRISQGLAKFLSGHAALSKRIESKLSKQDFAVVCQASPSVARLATQSHLRRLLASPKVLDVLMTLELTKEQSLAGEADLVEWWWQQRVCDQQAAAVEEQVATRFASIMADELCTELPRNAANGLEQAASALKKKGILRLTVNDGFRFSHDLFADWSRVMLLRSLGGNVFAFMRAHTENPPWLRAIRLFSQYLLERTGDLERWRAVLGQTFASAKELDEVPAENLQVLDAWLEGIAFCTDPKRVLACVKPDLFDQDGALLRRFLRRLLHVGTLPDPVIQDQWRKLAPDLADAASTLYRLPLHGVWLPVAQFLIANSEAVTQYAPVEIADFGPMWARLAEYIEQPWSEIADLVLTNAVKELRREVAGEYRHDRGPQRLAGGNESRVRIYLAGLHTASQHPDHVSKLALKAAGRIPWEDGDVAANTEPEWVGKCFERPRFLISRTYVRTESSAESWPDGPSRRSSDDFFHAWFDYGGAINLYRLQPKIACEITLALLLAWPKSRIDANSDHFEHERHGFNSDSDRMYPAFWTKGPFLLFLRENWRPALEMIVRLTNFATERYSDWWPYDPPVSTTTFATAHGAVSWSGNHQVFAWHRYHMNTPQAVTCALMALEKWFDECIEAGKPIADAIQLLYADGRSLVFAGLLIALGKRHPTLFVSELKPILFLRDLYLYDQQTVMNEFSGAASWGESKREGKLRHEWNQLPGRRTPLLDMCCQWFLQLPELVPILEEVCANWRQKAADFPAASEDRIVWLRWASNFDRSMWKETVAPDGRKAWSLERPPELRDLDAEKDFARRQSAMNLPMRCKDLLDKRQDLPEENVKFIWEKLQNWKDFEKDKSADEDEWASILHDPRHARAGLLAVLLCLGGKNLSDQLLPEVENELRKLLASPPNVAAMSPDDSHDDGEGFLARCAVRCWARSPANSEWREWVVYFATAYRYRIIAIVFEEAFRVRSELGPAYRELEAFAISFAAERQKANLQTHSHLTPDANILNEWTKEWILRFSEGRGPAWPDSWATVESTRVFPKGDRTKHRIRRGRRGYGFDTGVLLAVFYPQAPLSSARDQSERQHWLTVANECLQALLRTLPPAPEAESVEDEDWGHEVCREDERVFDVIAARLFQCHENERGQLYKPILDLRPAAHYFISRFLSAVLLESMRTDPPLVAELLTLWRAMAEYLFERPSWNPCKSHHCKEVWKDIFLYGTPFTSMGDECFKPLVQGMRALYERHVITHLLGDAYDQSSFVGFLTTKAGDCLLVGAFVWLRADWEKGDHWFWGKVAERSNFAQLLDHAWRYHFSEIRKNPDALKAFKALTINLAAQQDPVALEVQRQIGSAT